MRAGIAILGLLLALPRGAAAHDIPNDVTVQMFLRTLRRIANPLVEHSLAEESVAQSLVFGSDDYREFKSARAEKRDPVYRGR